MSRPIASRYKCPSQAELSPLLFTGHLHFKRITDRNLLTKSMKPRAGKPTALAPIPCEGSAGPIPSYQISDCGQTFKLRAHLFQNGELCVQGDAAEMVAIKRGQLDMDNALVVGRGVSAAVYVARHVPTGDFVAVKRISITTKVHRDEIDSELLLLKTGVVHPHVVRHFGAFYDADNHFVEIVMEFMHFSLQEVASFLKGLGQLEDVLAAITFQFASGLAFLHSQRLLHRDIKPSNVLVNAEGYVKIVDFGIAKAVTTLGVLSSYVGTELYMSPERLETTEYSFASDVWSFGLTLVSLAWGGNPWDAEAAAAARADRPPAPSSLFERMQRTRSGEAPRLPPTLSPAAHDFIARCLIAEPDRRATAAELLSHPFLAGQTMASAVELMRRTVAHVTTLVKSSSKTTREELIEEARRLPLSAMRAIDTMLDEQRPQAPSARSLAPV